MRRIEWMAVGWGGLVAAIGLLATADAGSTARVVAVVASFGIGGFLAGVRADELRAVHGALAAVAGYVFHAIFILILSVVDLVGGPAAPELVPGENGAYGLTALGGIAVAALGGLVAAHWLRPQGRDQRRRVA